MRTLWIGTFPAAGAGTPAGRGEGIWRATLGADGAVTDLRLIATAPAPTFLAVHPSGRWVYAVSEQTEGMVTAFEATDTLAARATVSSGGADPCHLALSPDARSLYVANYSSGTLGVVALDADGGVLGDRPTQVLGHEGTGPDTSRQESSHAHFVAVRPAEDVPSDGGGPDGGSRGEVVVADLGADVLRHYAVGPDGVLVRDGLTSLPPGTGPRHLAFSPDGRFCYVVGELDATVHVLERTPGGLAPRQVVSLAGRAERGEHGWFVPAGRLLASHVEHAGDRLLVGMRVDDRLDEFAVSDDGSLTHTATRPLGGWPRHFAVVGDTVVVAGQTDDALEVLTPHGAARVAIPAPACVVVA